MGALALYACISTVAALAVGPGVRAAATRTRAPMWCICINCKLVDRCRLYHWVEDMHEQPHVTDTPDFDPPDPQVQVFLRNEEEEANVSETERVDDSGDGRSNDAVRGLKSRFLSTEYDVFACDAFVADQGKWLRLMPDAEFMPT